MKRIFLLSLIFSTLSLISAKAQNNVGIGTTTPVASALLDLTATDKGLLIPRVTLVAATNGTTPVAGPATGLLVYNIGGALTAGFYYWDGAQWVQVGAASAPTCVTLDGAYDCGGSGVGRNITVDAGRVEFTIPLGATSNEGLYIVSNKGTAGVPTACSWLIQNQWGVGLQVDNNLGTNLFSAIQGTTNTTQTSTTSIPAGVAGYADNIGIGTGVWAEYSGTGSGGFGLYAKSTGSNIAARMHGLAYPGAYISTASTTGQALQVTSGNAAYANPCAMLVGWTQMDVSSNVDCHTILFNNSAGEPSIVPQAAYYGYLGTSGYPWFYGYAQTFVSVSRPEIKRDITPVDNNLSGLILSDIKKTNLYFYKFKNETDEYNEGAESKTRYNMHLGMLVTNAPDYLQDNTFNGIDIYALGSFALMGVKINTEQIENMTKNVNSLSKNAIISDFGFNSTGTLKEIKVEYAPEFSAQLTKNQIPVVNITPSSPEISYYIKSQDNKGFVVACTAAEFSFNWVAMAKIEIREIQNPDINNDSTVNPKFLSQLRVSQDKKDRMKAWGSKPQEKPMQLIGNTEGEISSSRIKR